MKPRQKPAFTPRDFAAIRAARPLAWCHKCGPAGRWHEHWDPDRSKGERPPVARPEVPT